MSVGARVFTALFFGALGTFFLILPASLLQEYQSIDWFAIMAFHSHLFLFFPTYGLVVLLAFYLPAAAMIDMYWKHIRLGRVRLIGGFLLVLLVSGVLSAFIATSGNRSIWRISPRALVSDRGDPPGCATGNATCQRVPFLQALGSVRQVAQSRIGLVQYIRDCTPDPTLEAPLDAKAERLCFATGSKLNAMDCCVAQEQFSKAVNAAASQEDQRSLTSGVYEMVLPAQIVFFFCLIVIGLLLARRRRQIDKYYYHIATNIERLILIGSAALLFFPFSLHAYLQSSGALLGPSQRAEALAFLFSFVFGAWALLLLFFFLRRDARELQNIVRIAGGLAAAVVILKYDTVVGLAVRYLGAGSDIFTFSTFGLVPACLAALSIMIIAKTQVGSGAEGVLASELTPDEIAQTLKGVAIERPREAARAARVRPESRSNPGAAGTAAPKEAIFVSYRRKDSDQATGRIYEELRRHFGKDEIFKDVDGIPLGVDFREYLSSELQQCRALLAIIGRDWLTVRDKKDSIRLADPGDHVRIEIETALERNIPVIPIFIGETSVPTSSELPPSMAKLAFRNGIRVRADPDFKRDMERLIRGLEIYVGAKQ